MNDTHRTSTDATTPSAVRDVPLATRVALVHGYLQLVANEHGCDILHLKGAAVHPALRGAEVRVSFDVDVLVRPTHVEKLLGALHDLGWRKLSGFEEGSAFGHATNLRHALGLIDLHRSWPGFEMQPSAAFDALWAERDVTDIADVSCAVPSLDDQRLILLLHHARSGGLRDDDLARAWTNTDSSTRGRVRARAGQLRGELALAAATGELERFRGRREYRLWRYFSRGDDSRWEEWRGRFQAADGRREKLRVLRGLVRVNHDLLTSELGHDPNTREYAEAYRHRVHVAVLDAARAVRAIVSRGPR